LTSVSHGRKPSRKLPSTRKQWVSQPSALALRALDHSLGESPAFAPSRETVREMLAGAARLLAGSAYSPPLLTATGVDRRPGLSLGEALWAVRPGGAGAGHVHCERFLAALVEAPFIGAWEQGATKGRALALLRRAERLLRPPLRRGPHVTVGQVEAGAVRFVREELAAHRARLSRPPPPKQLNLLEES
jgi:hypothetical protein